MLTNITSLFSALLSPLYLAWGFGDPHVTTLDGREYTFNGLGEYVLGRVDDEIEIQARTALATPNTSATIFSVLAVRGAPGTEVVEVSMLIFSFILMCFVGNGHKV